MYSVRRLLNNRYALERPDDIPTTNRGCAFDRMMRLSREHPDLMFCVFDEIIQKVVGTAKNGRHIVEGMPFSGKEFRGFVLEE